VYAKFGAIFMRFVLEIMRFLPIAIRVLNKAIFRAQ
jgi:hypothetical protein